RTSHCATARLAIAKATGETARVLPRCSRYERIGHAAARITRISRQSPAVLSSRNAGALRGATIGCPESDAAAREIGHAAASGDHVQITAGAWRIHVVRPHNWRMPRGSVMSIALVLASLAASRAAAEPDDDAHELPRKPDATFAMMFRGPFRSARLFAMPTTDVVGAYILTISGEGSLLQKPGVLTSAGVAAIGFGDIAQ